MTEDATPGDGQDRAGQQRSIDDEVRETGTRLTERDAQREADLSRREEAADARDAAADRREAGADARDERQAHRESALDQHAREVDERQKDLGRARDDQREVDQEVRTTRARMPG